MNLVINKGKGRPWMKHKYLARVILKEGKVRYIYPKAIDLNELPKEWQPKALRKGAIDDAVDEFFKSGEGYQEILFIEGVSDVYRLPDSIRKLRVG